MTKNLDDALGLSSVPVVIEDEERLPAVVNDEEQVRDDIEEARDNIKNAIALSQQAVQDMLSIAQQSQHPKAYEVLNSMIKTYGDLSMGLVDAQTKKQRLMNKKGNVEEGDGNKTINNNLFVGSTAELQKMLEDMKNKQE